MENDNYQNGDCLIEEVETMQSEYDLAHPYISSPWLNDQIHRGKPSERVCNLTPSQISLSSRGPLDSCLEEELA
jgi:hypothetical protein